MSLTKVALGLVLAGGAGGAGLILNAREAKQATEKYGLDIAQTGFMGTCKSALSSAKKKFRNTSATDGCACIAGKLGRGLGAVEYSHLDGVMKVVFATADAGDRSDIARTLVGTASRSGLSETRAHDLTARYLTAAKACLAKA